MSAPRAALVLLLGLCACCGLCACDEARGAVETSRTDGGEKVSLALLQDPESCKGCHREHYLEWQSSMHAYAARDPVFIAMNERGQLETGGELGDFCIKCHAPMALELGLTQDGLNLPDLQDPSARGVTCYFCHSVQAVEGDHNRALVLAHDGVMRGGLGAGQDAADARNAAPPQANSAHHSEYSKLHDGARRESAALCGACHDVVNRADVALERTFAEWRGSRFGQDAGHDAGELETCAGCHMDGYAGRAVADAGKRRLHRHLWPGVDVALEADFPGASAQTAAILCAFKDSLDLELQQAAGATGLERVEVTLTNVRVGHGWPSGATQDRRAWVELVAYDARDEIVFERGVIEAGEIVGVRQPELDVLRDRLFDADGKPVHMFWQAAPTQEHPRGYESDLLPAPEAGGAPATRTSRYSLPATTVRVHARLRLQSIGLDVLDDFQGLQLPISERLIDHGYQAAPTLRSRVPTITVPGTERELVLDAGSIRASVQPASGADCDAQGYTSLLAD